MTILLVDSDKKVLDREMWRFTQRPFAVTVSLHSSGDDAIRFSMCHDVDMVFTRAVLSDMTGRELVEKLHQINPKVKCHILSSYEEIPISRFLGQSSNFTDKGSAQPQPLEEKQAAWVHTAAGGYYWAGACFRDGYLVLGTDDGAPGYTIGYGQILCLDAVTGKVMDSLTLPYPGDVRCAVVYDSNTDAYYFTSNFAFMIVIIYNVTHFFAPLFICFYSKIN